MSPNLFQKRTADCTVAKQSNFFIGVDVFLSLPGAFGVASLRTTDAATAASACSRASSDLFDVGAIMFRTSP